MPGLRIDEVLQMAMQAEEAGIAFYETVARKCSDLRVADLCRRLAADEARHLQAFGAMREDVVKRSRPRRLELEEMAILQSAVDGCAVPTAEECRRLASDGSVAKVLDAAIRSEKNAVALYSGLVSGVDDKESLRKIIEEEQRHAEELAALRKTISQ
jgi:rubrerythrin